MSNEKNISVDHLAGQTNFGTPFLQSGVRQISDLPSFEVLGVRVHAVEMAETIEYLHNVIADRQSHARFVAVTSMHGIAESRRQPAIRHVLNSADLVVADGTPLVWIGRTKGLRFRRRVSGCDLVDNFCRASGSTYRHFFYGGTSGAAMRLATTLQDKFGIRIAGTYTPPFRPLTNEEESDLAAFIERTSPDVLWVGLSTPKQEAWMYQHRSKLKVPLMLGVGAAFDLNSGIVRRAPVWMRDHGLEWLYRLAAEPRRLWKRYLITIPYVFWFIGLELMGLSKAPATDAHAGQVS